MFREKVERAGDFEKLELMEPERPCPNENVERVGDGMPGFEGTSPLCDNRPMFRYLSPGSSILSLGLQSFCSEPSKSVGARMVRRDGNPL